MEIEDEQLFTISELSALFGISTRAIRFYETKQLLNPKRVGGNRVYSHSDRVRLTLILRAKRLGFSLADIREYIDLYDSDPDHREQVQVLLVKLSKRKKELIQQQQDIATTISELEALETICLEQMANMDNSNESG
ncbi:MerR family DNA-binding transcriptional regulator [Leucothrix sargassi]|nr:MerR family DNA-binding transcriptional regulator [Leucothrix sargassi]